MQRMLTMLVFLQIFPFCAYGATYYVGKTGSDNYNCTQARSLSAPKLTINAGLGCLSGGDTLVIKGGTYVESIAGNVIPSGSQTTPTVVQGAPGETVIIRPKTGNDAGDVLGFYQRSYITVKGLTLDGANVSAVVVGFRHSSHNVRLENNIIKGAPNNSCIDASRDQTTDRYRFEIVGNVIGPCGNDSEFNKRHGVYLRAWDSLIESNIIHGMPGGYGIGLGRPVSGKGADNIVIRYNRIFGNASRGVGLGGGSNVTVYNNLVYDNRGAPDSVAGIFIGNGSPSSYKIYNNTIYNNKGRCVWIREGTGHIVKNNICFSNDDNSVLDAPGVSTISNNMFSNPSFIDSTRGNFALQVNSQAIDTGTLIREVATDFTGVSRPQGMAYDIGAYEYVSNVITAPASPSNLRVETNN